MKLLWHTEKRKVSELIPFAYNPRILTEERKQKLIASLEKYDLVEIPVINLDNVLLAGHQRVKILLFLNRGDEEIDVRVPNRMLTEIEVKEYNVISNVSIGFWDIELLEQAFSDIDLESLGLNLDAIEVPVFSTDKKPEEESDFIIQIPKTPVSMHGDILVFESLDKKITHTLICGPSDDKEVVSQLFADKKTDLIITDPPYNVNYTGGTKEALKIQNDNMSDSNFYEFLLNFYKNAFEFAKDGCPIYVFHADTEGANFRTAFKNAGFKLSQCLIWLKNSIVLGRQDYHWQHEPILYGWKQGARHPWYSDRSQKSVIQYDKPQRNDDHPTMKPLELIDYLINNSSKRFDLVCDYFTGSGTTLIACEKSKRNFIGIELDPIYVDVIIRRWHSYMVDNGLDYSIKRNGNELHSKEIQEYYSRIG